jgi:hypothetical protein
VNRLYPAKPLTGYMLSCSRELLFEIGFVIVTTETPFTVQHHTVPYSTRPRRRSEEDGEKELTIPLEERNLIFLYACRRRKHMFDLRITICRQVSTSSVVAWNRIVISCT